jgi:CheY-like chemotaxis protein
MKTGRLLLVDDDRDNLDVLTVILSEAYEVVSCASAAEALMALDAVKPDLLLLDIRMSPVDGLQCLEAVRALPEYSSTPAIALTAFARDAEKAAFVAAGFQAVVTKPILDPGELVAVVGTWLRSAARGDATPTHQRKDRTMATPSSAAPLDGAHSIAHDFRRGYASPYRSEPA